MRSADQREIIFLEESFDDAFAEGVADPAVVQSPADHFLLVCWICPELANQKKSIPGRTEVLHQELHKVAAGF